MQAWRGGSMEVVGGGGGVGEGERDGNRTFRKALFVTSCDKERHILKCRWNVLKWSDG